MPRPLNYLEVKQIFKREQELKQEYTRFLLQVPDETLQARTTFYDTLIRDKINNEYNIEQEDFTLGELKYNLREDPQIKKELARLE